jgi:hypothetical protein
LKSSFEHFLNINQKSSAEQVARYVDNKMKGQKGLTEIDIELRLDQVMILFKYLHEKDIFEAFYKKHLSKRLLLGKSASYDLEKSMLAKLKAVSFIGPLFFLCLTSDCGPLLLSLVMFGYSLLVLACVFSCDYLSCLSSLGCLFPLYLFLFVFCFDFLHLRLFLCPRCFPATLFSLFFLSSCSCCC